VRHRICRQWLLLVIGICLFGSPRAFPATPSATPGAALATKPAVTATARSVPTKGSPRTATRAQPETTRDRPLSYDLILAAITSFAGAAAAAGIVFFLQNRKERRDRRDDEVRELRRVQFAIMGRQASLRDYWTQWLEPALAKKGRWGALQSLSGISPPPPLSLERIGFLLETDPNLLERLHLLDQRFDSLLETAERYSKFRDEATVRIEEGTQGADDSGVISGEELRKLAGPRLHYQLETLAAALFERWPVVRAELTERFDEVGDHIVKGYQGKRLRVESPGP
jgi:hypothetical protein